MLETGVLFHQGGENTLKLARREADLVMRFEAANQKMYHILAQNFEFRELTKSEFIFLCLVHKNEKAGHPMCTSDASDMIRITKPAVTQIANNLQRKGYLVRVPDQTDGRKVHFAVTPTGEAILKEQTDALHESVMSAFHSVGYDRMQQFVATFEKLVELIGGTVS